VATQETAVALPVWLSSARILCCYPVMTMPAYVPRDAV
jgi:hypothetical protein